MMPAYNNQKKQNQLKDIACARLYIDQAKQWKHKEFKSPWATRVQERP